MELLVDSRKAMYDVLEKDKVLVKLPTGKHFVTNPSVAKKISAQKGPTCWYYAMRYLTPRFGKDAKFHLKERAAEIAFSSYRKALTAIDKMNKQGDSLYELASQLIGPGALLNQKNLAFVIDFCRSLLIEISEKELTLVKAFMSQSDKSELRDFITHHQTQLKLAAAKECLNALDLNPNSELEKFTSQLAKKVEGYSKVDEVSRYQDLIADKMAKNYKLKFSSWMPNQSIDSLLFALKENGAIKVQGYLGKPYYNGVPRQSSNSFGSKKVLFWPKGSYNVESSDAAHAIVIVGAKKTDSQDLVYFIDPNDSSDEYDKVYCMSYRLLCAKAMTIYGNQRTLHKDSSDNARLYDLPYSLVANHEYQKECESKYTLE
jgi:hypothetical protein